MKKYEFNLLAIKYRTIDLKVKDWYDKEAVTREWQDYTCWKSFSDFDVQNAETTYVEYLLGMQWVWYCNLTKAGDDEPCPDVYAYDYNSFVSMLKNRLKSYTDEKGSLFFYHHSITDPKNFPNVNSSVGYPDMS